MFLETWMLITLALLFGFCAWYNRRSGVLIGIDVTLDHLKKHGIIFVNENGEVHPVQYFKIPQPSKNPE
jgi:hypothetical protein